MRAGRVFYSATPCAHVQFKAKRSRNQEQMRNKCSMKDWNPLETVGLRGGAHPYPGCRHGFSRTQTPPGRSADGAGLEPLGSPPKTHGKIKKIITNNFRFTRGNKRR